MDVKTKAKAFKQKYNHVEDIVFSFLHKYLWLIVMILSFVLSIVAKSFVYPFAKVDYDTLARWMREYHELGSISKGLASSISDYTQFYNYFLCFTGVVFEEGQWVYIIKIFDLLFETSFSVAVFLIIYNRFHKLNYSALAFCISLIIPSVLLNGAFWAQCDIIYASFVIWSFYFALKKKHNLSMIFFAIGFSIKLQMIFFLPFLFLLFLKREIKIWQFLYIPLVYFVIALPALFCGKPFAELLTPYYIQLTEYSDRLSLSAPSIYAFFDNSLTESFSSLPVVIFIVFTTAYVFYLYYRDYELNCDNLVTIALASCLFSPFFLPNMHERYFLLADLFSILYVFIKKKGFFIALLINFASVICCSSFLFHEVGESNLFPGFDPIRIGAIFNLIAVTLVIIELIKIPEKVSLED